MSLKSIECSTFISRGTNGPSILWWYKRWTNQHWENCAWIEVINLAIIYTTAMNSFISHFKKWNLLTCSDKWHQRSKRRAQSCTINTWTSSYLCGYPLRRLGHFILFLLYSYTHKQWWNTYLTSYWSYITHTQTHGLFSWAILNHISISSRQIYSNL